jgi:hypothetical protein
MQVGLPNQWQPSPDKDCALSQGMTICMQSASAANKTLHWAWSVRHVSDSYMMAVVAVSSLAVAVVVLHHVAKSEDMCSYHQDRYNDIGLARPSLPRRIQRPNSFESG